MKVWVESVWNQPLYEKDAFDYSDEDEDDGGNKGGRRDGECRGVTRSPEQIVDAHSQRRSGSDSGQDDIKIHRDDSI